MAFFNAGLLKRTSKNEYVCFLDIMGIKNKMSKSLFKIF